MTVYKNLLESNSLELIRVKKQIRLLTFLRLVVFVTFSLFAYFSWGNTPIFISSIFLGIAIFLITIRYWVDVNLKFEKIKQKIHFLNLELEITETNKGLFDSGKEFSNSKHAFSNDLDLFAEHGIFAYINRTTSFLGKKILAEILLEGNNKREKTNQQIEFLSHEIEWTIDFRVAGAISSREKAYNKEISNFAKLDFKNPKILQVLRFLIPIISISALILNSFELISSSLLGIALTACILPTGILLKQTNLWASTISEYEAKINTLLDQLVLLKKLSSEEAKTMLDLNEFHSIENEFKQWKTLSKRFDLRMNIVVSIPLNLFFAWDIQQRISLENWTKKNSKNLSEWENKLAYLEVLISGATLRYNNQNETIFAEILKYKKSYETKNMAHPLIPSKKRISNDFVLKEEENFYILTGPNMAGKSTYLRSLGTNIVFANAGFPVFAQTFSIPEIKLFSSMRTSDDLSNESSYFHAELTRLKQMKDVLIENKNLFVLLDEILKGTNSKDKEEGSKKFLQKMKNLGAKGIIATHDLSLCTLSNENESFTNFYFDSTIADNELSFDYKLKKGICQNMNASFLLKKMELID
ncbi:MAG: hypothetical protein V4622_13760 [Bacteroidota bacterium]